jgi:hypothetical protein
MGASGKRHLGALRDDTSKSARERGILPRSEPAKPVAEFYGDLRALFLAAPLPACHRVVTSLLGREFMIAIT